MAVDVTTVQRSVIPVLEVDERVFNIFFHGNFLMLTRFAFRITRQREISEEIAADAFLKLWERRSGFKNTMAMKSFVFTAVRFACLNFLRDSRRERDSLRLFGWFCEKHQRSVLHDIINTEVCREAMGAVYMLPGQCRRVIGFLFAGGKTPAEVARLMQVTVSTVRNQKARAFSLLRRQMEYTGNFPVDHEFIFPEL